VHGRSRAPFVQGAAFAAPREHWCPAANPSKFHTTDAHRTPFRCETPILRGGGLHCGNKRLARWLTSKASKLFDRYDDYFISSVHGDVLWSVTSHFPNKLAEARLSVLQQPRRLWRGALDTPLLTSLGVPRSSHSDQIITVGQIGKENASTNGYNIAKSSAGVFTMCSAPARTSSAAGRKPQATPTPLTAAALAT
jgi:hypothetical protein